MFKSKLRLIFAAPLLVFGFGTAAALGDIVPGTVSTDPFDSTLGTVVVAHDTIVDPINVFRTTGGFENGHTLMRNGGLNSVSFINFDTAAPVSIIGVRLFAHDERWWCWGSYCTYRRAINHFKLLADLDGDAFFETTVVDTTINPDYSAQPGNNATDPHFLDLSVSIAPVKAQHWRFETTQGSDLQPYEGARIVELDAIPTPDDDGDGVLNNADQCSATPPGEVVNANGCSIAQICPCGSTWKNHGAYVSCVAQTAEAFVAEGLITEMDKDIVVSNGAKSDCGTKK